MLPYQKQILKVLESIEDDTRFLQRLVQRKHRSLTIIIDDIRTQKQDKEKQKQDKEKAKVWFNKVLF